MDDATIIKLAADGIKDIEAIHVAIVNITRHESARVDNTITRLLGSESYPHTVELPDEYYSPGEGYTDTPPF
jgi:hypothetical protein